MECFNDFCLACDKQSPHGGAYCSQACRLADLETANATMTTSPSSTFHRAYSTPGSAYQTYSTSGSAYQTYSTSGSGFHNHSTPGSGYQLPHAHSFSPKSTGPSSRPTSSYFPLQYSHADAASVPRALTPSSSRTSLSSTMSTSISSTQGGLSERAKAELRSYYNSFDKVKESKRRSSTR